MEKVVQLVSEIWNLTGEMSPYLLFGFAVAGLLSVVVQRDFVERHLGRTGWRQTLKATVIGVPMPLCSCGVIPVAASLRQHGAGKGATTAFLAATPQTGVDSIAATWGMMGSFFAAVRVLVAFVCGMVAGTLVDAVEGADSQSDPAERAQEPAAAPTGGKLRAAIRYGFVTLPGDIGRSLLIGLVIAGVLSALIPPDFFSSRLENSALIYLLITLVAIPMYVCSTGSIPVAMAFVRAGLPPGAVLVFLIAGPATNAATISMLWKVLGRRVVFIYLGTIIVVAWLCGALLDSLPFRVFDAAVMQHAMGGGWRWLPDISAGVLLLVIAYAMVQSRRCSGDTPCAACASGSHERDYVVSGMHCSRCAEAIKQAVLELDGVRAVHIQLAPGRMQVVGDAPPDQHAIFEKVQALGYGIAKGEPHED